MSRHSIQGLVADQATATEAIPIINSGGNQVDQAPHDRPLGQGQQEQQQQAAAHAHSPSVLASPSGADTPTPSARSGPANEEGSQC